MKSVVYTRTFILRLIAIGIVSACRLYADTHYVNIASATPQSPFTNGWASAATNIQDAIDASQVGDLILVTNGVYDTGGAVYAGNNRVYLPSDRTIQAVSANPGDTLIVGAPDTAGGIASNGSAAVRCVAVKTSGTIIGFTLTNGWTATLGAAAWGGGTYCESSAAVFSNCVITSCRAHSYAGGARRGKFIDCTISGNTSGSRGGGGYTCVFINCVISNNTANGNNYGGGGYICTATDSIIVGNWAASYGGGLYGGSATRCLILNNSGGIGGNSACSFTNCLIAGNISRASGGGGLNGGVAVNCTIVSNKGVGGTSSAIKGVSAAYVTNCIIDGNIPCDVYGMSGESNCYATCIGNVGGTLTHVDGLLNIYNTSPLFVNASSGDYHLIRTSPCVDAGTNMDWMVGDVDLDGTNSRIINFIVDMGAYEYLPPPAGTVISMW